MISAPRVLRILSRGYGAVAIGLLPGPDLGGTTWNRGLHAALQCLDPGATAPLLTTLEYGGTPIDPGFLDDLRSALVPFLEPPPAREPSIHARHVGENVTVPAHWGEQDLSMHAEMAAALAWAEADRRTHRHVVQAATAARERNQFVRGSLLPALGQNRDRLEAGSVACAALAWIALWDDARHVKE